MKKRKAPDKATRVKAVARERVGSPKPARVIAGKGERAKPKHKKDIQADV